MATLRSIVELDDRVTSKLERISLAAGKVDIALESVDNRLEKIARTSGETSRHWSARMAEMQESTRLMRVGVNHEIGGIKRDLLSLTARKHHIRIDADTTLANAKIRVLKHELNGLQRQSISPGAGGIFRGSALTGGFSGGGGGSRFSRSSSGGGGSSGVGANVGPLRLSGSALTTAVSTVGPAAVSALAGVVGVLTTNVVALGAGLVGSVSILGAFTAGIAAIGIPVLNAAKGVQKWEKQLTSASSRLEKTRSGTRAYTNALNNYNRVLRSMPKDTKEVIGNFEDLKSTWHALVTEGDSGKSALHIINSSLITAKGLVPFVAKEMDLFTKSGSKLFEMIRADSPNLSKLLETVFKPWPGYFNRMGVATYQFGKGFLGMLIAAKPMTDFLVIGIQKLSFNFNKWANSVQGQKSMGRFFSNMVPVFKELVVLGGKIGSAMLKIAGDPSMQRRTIDFTKLLEDFVDALPAFVIKMTNAASALGPQVRRIVNFIRVWAEDMSPYVDDIVGGFNIFTGAFTNASPRIRHIAEALFFLTGVKGLPVVGKAVGFVTDNIGKLISGVAKKVAGIDSITASLTGLAGAQAAVDAGGVAGGGRKRARKAAHGQVWGSAAEGALPFAGSRLFGRGYDSSNLSKSAQLSHANAGISEVFGKPAAAAGWKTNAGVGGTAAGVAGGRLAQGVSLSGMGSGAGLAEGGAGIGAGTLAVAAGVAAVAAGTMAYAWKKNLNDIRGFVKDTWKEVSGDFKNAGKDISDTFHMLGISSKDFVDGAKKGWSFLKADIGFVGSLLIHVLGGAFKILGSTVEGFARALKGLIEFGKGAFTGDWSMMWKGVSDIFGGTWRMMSGLVTGVFSTIKAAIGDLATFAGIDLGPKTPARTPGAQITTKLPHGGAGTYQPDIGSGSGSVSIHPGGSVKKGKGDAFGWLGNAISSVGSTVAHGAAGAAKSVASNGLGAIEGTVMASLSPLDHFGQAGAFTKAAFKNVYIDAKNHLLAMGGIGHAGIQKGGGGAGLDLDSLGSNSADGAGKIGGLNPKLTQLAEYLHNKFGVYVGEGIASGGHAKNSWHYSGDAMDMWGSQTQLQRVWNSLRGNAGIGQLLWHGQQEYNGGKVSAIPAGGAGSDPMHMGHVHIGSRGDAPADRIPANRVTAGVHAHGGHDFKIEFHDVHIGSDMDLNEIASKLADKIEGHLSNLPMEPGSEMAS